MEYIFAVAVFLIFFLIGRAGASIKKEGRPLAKVKANPDIEIFATKIEEVQQSELGEAHDGYPISFYVVRAIMDIARRKGIDKELRAELKKRGITNI